ncbi:cadherin-like domain-containing protein [Nostocaceae cyanobacterium CENA357]|uniref:Cadherin-like domain-containing protein n=1 Tax=Atlanticothrix silvestris CENA357 TaxID=1725252 RepID=A0A8J7L4E8_9CYAN|nr:Ig-like domain-containing protein [Atlanticothrix silvestris]MBH8554919.1 cadherin-like domain-containing protein [Atlanticothrix silvestris CENA357]
MANSTFNLSTLNGSNGFFINGFAAAAFSGRSVSSAGDINGDGIDDLIIGAVSPSYGSYSGQSYIVFGKSSGFSASLELFTFNSSNGFLINGINAGDFSGSSVSSAGDINGDGIDDLIIGASRADPNGVTYSGQSYVVYGNPAPVLDLNGNSSGIDFSTTFSGTPVSIVNSDFSLSDNSTTLVGATITITNLLDGAAESLDATAISNITATYNPTTGILTLGGTDTVANYRQVLASIIYSNTANTVNTTNGVIEFIVDDGQGFSNTSAVAKTTLGFNLNQAPIAVDDAFSTNEDKVFNGNVLVANPTTADSDSNNDTLTVTQVNGNPAAVGNQIKLTSGALLTLNSNGIFAYNPNGQFQSLGVGATASNSFTYTISDGKGGTDTATVNFTINGVNDPPVAGDDSASANQNTPLTLLAADLLANDTDVNSETLNITGVSNALNGSVALNNNGDIVFTPTTSFTGNSKFDYTINDGNGGTDTGLVTVAVGANFKGTNNDDNLNGTPGNDIIDGLNGQDTILGNAGNDNLTGNTGSDLLFGGIGSDRLIGGDGQDILAGNAGNDNLQGDNGDDHLFGDNGQDRLTGDAGNDDLAGGNGDDLLFGGIGSDRLIGGDGQDTLAGNAGNDNLQGNNGDDLLFGANGNDLLFGGNGQDILNGDAGNDNLAGGIGSDRLTGGDEQDTLTGDAGNDNLQGNNGDDLLFGGIDSDRLIGGDGQDTLTGNAGNDNLQGDNGDDQLFGANGNDSLLGGDGQDILVGGAGNDFLIGGKGDDNLNGGASSDIFVLAKAAEHDIITDFSLGQSDKIGLSGLSFNQLSFSDDQIRLGNQTLAILTNFDTTTLTQNNFISV